MGTNAEDTGTNEVDVGSVIDTKINRGSFGGWIEGSWGEPEVKFTVFIFQFTSKFMVSRKGIPRIIWWFPIGAIMK